jgi:hypothetical protein
MACDAGPLETEVQPDGIPCLEEFRSMLLLLLSDSELIIRFFVKKRKRRPWMAPKPSPGTR